MYVTVEGSVELASYKMKDMAYDWVVIWKNSRGENATLMSWQVFQDTFLERFFLCKLREAMVEVFMNLRQGSMSVKKYCLKFNQLSKYAPDMMVDPTSGMSKFVTGVSSLVIKECKTAMVIADKDLARLIIHAQQIKVES